ARGRRTAPGGRVRLSTRGVCQQTTQGETGVTDLETVKNFIALDLKLKALEGEVKRVKAERDAIEATLLSQFEQEGLQNVRIGDIPMPVMEHEEFLSNWRG